MRVLAVDTMLLDLPLREPFVAGHGRTDRRRIVVVRIETEIGTGWGECAALPEPTYTAEWADGAFEEIDGGLSGRVLGHRIDPAAMLPPPSTGDGPMARAGVEMAVLDAVLRHRGRSLADHLGVTRDRVPAGASVGLGPIEATATRCRALVDEGFGRLKLKITPGHDVGLVQAVLDALGPDRSSVELQVDGNGTYDPDAAAGRSALLAVAAAGVAAIEQPFPVDRPDAAADLIGALRSDGLPARVVADEAVESVADLDRLIESGAATGVSIKPPRVGGLAVAADLHRRCVDRDLAATAGGMLETGLGRRSLAAVAALPGFTLTGDLSPAGRWLAEDPWPDLTMGDGTIEVPTGPGVGADPDPDVLERRTIRRSRRTG